MDYVWQNIKSIKFGDVWSKIGPILLQIFLAIVVFYVGRKLIKYLISFIGKVCDKRLDKGITGFLCAVLNVIAQVVLVVIIADMIGLPTTSFIAVLGSAGLAIGLSLQGSLSNFAGGVLILITKPFVIGDYVCVGAYEGTVTSIGICYTKLMTIDNRVVILPNGSLSNSNLVNVNTEPSRRIDMTIPVSYDDDIRAVKHMLRELAEGHMNLLENKPVDVYVKDFGSDAINIGFRVWVKTELYWDVLWELQEEIRYKMLELGFSIPYKQLDVAIKNGVGKEQK